MKILGLLQNQWVREVSRVKALYARRPHQRRQVTAMLLFAGSLTGRRLRRALGDWCERIEWEEASPVITARPRGIRLNGEPDHVQRAIDEVEPRIVIAFGQLARVTLESTNWVGVTIAGPHPASRVANIHEQLCAVRTALEAHAPQPAPGSDGDS